jgi:alpha-2-macroglobulin
LTAFRVMVVAVADDDRYGRADTTLLVTRALAVRPSLPRFVRASDSLFAGAAINTRDARSGTADVEAHVVGAALRGPPSMSVSLSRERGSEARFAFSVPARGSVRDSIVFRLAATSGTDRDAAEARIPVRPDFHTRTHTTIGAVAKSEDVTLSLPPEIDASRSRLRLRIGTSPLSTMLAAYRWLRAYPYDCTEQIASVGRAMIAVWRATRNTRTDALGGNPIPKLQELADELARRQRSDGAISFWRDDSWSSMWLTSYAGLFLLDARDVGVRVDSGVIARISGFLTKESNAQIDTGGMNRFERRYNRLYLGARVAAVDYLRRAGQPDTARETALLQSAVAMTWEDRLRFAEVIASRRDLRAAAEELVDAAWRATTVAGRRIDLPDTIHAIREFPSRIAPASRLLSASLKLRPQQRMLSGLIETVLQMGRGERGLSWSTQDYASVVIALSSFVDANSTDRAVRTRIGDKTWLARRPASGVDTSISMPLTGLLERDQSGKPSVRIHLESPGSEEMTYFALEVDEVPLAAPVTPDIRGIVVERWYERFSDGAPVTAVNEGELVRVRLRVTVPADRMFVVMEDPLPAGFEPIDLRLRTSGTLAPFQTSESEAARRAGDATRDGPAWQAWLYGRWDDGWWSPWEHKALYDDRVVYSARMLWTGSYTATYVARATTAGSFVAPPAFAEEMYNPGVSGRTGGVRVSVETRR